MLKKQLYSNVSDDYLNKLLASKGLTKAQYDRLPSSAKLALELSFTVMEQEGLAKQGSDNLPSEIEEIRNQSQIARLGDDEKTKKTIMVASVVAGSIIVLGIITALIIRKNRLK